MMPASPQSSPSPTQVDPEEERRTQLRAVLPDHGHLAVDLRVSHAPIAHQAEQREDQTAVEVGVEGEQPAVLHHVRQVVLQVDRVERAHRARPHAEQRAAQREVQLAVHPRRVSDVKNTPRTHPITITMHESTVRRDDRSPNSR